MPAGGFGGAQASRHYPHHGEATGKPLAAGRPESGGTANTTMAMLESSEVTSGTTAMNLLDMNLLLAAAAPTSATVGDDLGRRCVARAFCACATGGARA